MTICFVLVASGCNQASGKNQYLIPDGYVGWIHIIYDQSTYPEIKKEDGIYTFPIGEDGILKVSNKDYAYGTSVDKFFYVDDKGNRIRELDSEKEIHNGNIGNRSDGGSVSNGVEQTIEGLPTVESFFIGDKSLIKDYEDVYPEDEMEQTK